MGDALTIAQRELLEAVRRGEVENRQPWDTKKPTYDVWRRPGEPSKRVTGVMARLRHKGLVRRGSPAGQSIYSARPWELTEAGASVVSDA